MIIMTLFSFQSNDVNIAMVWTRAEDWETTLTERIYAVDFALEPLSQ